MKTNIKFLIFPVLIAVTAACSSGGKKTEATEAREVKNAGYDQQYLANTSESVIEWQGYKPTGTHYGTINITDGNLETRDGKIVGGSFTIDMNSINVLDLTDADKNKKLTGHLKSDDFFDVETYPKSEFVITNVTGIEGTAADGSMEKGDIIATHAITGNLTMKDETKSITFNAKISMDENSIVAETNQFFIDRVQWNVQYGSKTLFSDLKDNFINDEMGLTIRLIAENRKDMASN